MVSTRKKQQHKRQLSQLIETLNIFVVGSNTNVCAIGKKILKTQTNGRSKNFERIIDVENSACQNQVIEDKIDGKSEKTFDNAVMTVKNCKHGAILTALDNVLIPRVEMAVRSITGSSSQGPRSVVQKPARRYFTGNTENALLMSASSQLDKNDDQGRFDETRINGNLEDGNFPAFKPNYDRRAHTYQNCV